MSLFNSIEDLRRKPERVRQRIALSISAGITFIVFVFWFINFSFTASSINPLSETNTQVDNRGAITVFIDNIQTGFVEVKNGIISLLP